MKNIHPLFRVNIILLGEKLKPSSTFNGQEDTEAILKELGLYYVVTETPNGLIFDATYDKDIYEQFKATRKLENQENKSDQEDKMNPKEWQMTCDHEYFGRIYGYPKCCIDVYSKYMRTGIRPQESVELDQIPQELYCIDHTPCSIKCKESLELSRKYKNALERIDPEALKALLDFNKNGFV